MEEKGKQGLRSESPAAVTLKIFRTESGLRFEQTPLTKIILSKENGQEAMRDLFRESMTRNEAQTVLFRSVNGKTEKEIEEIKREYARVLPIIMEREQKQRRDALTSDHLAKEEDLDALQENPENGRRTIYDPDGENEQGRSVCDSGRSAG